jgi:outer membrane protein OmpA-like peptidoglycan-associated protein/uncharacterized protein YidB (DUF937 family)
MAIFDALIDDLGSRFGLGASAGPLMREVLGLVTGSPGGVSGFLNTLKSAGLSSEVASWMGQANASALPVDQVERALGSSVLGGVASRLGLAPTLVSTAMGYALPKVIGLLTPGGKVPAALPADVRNFLAAAPAPRVADATVRTTTTAPATAQVAPRRIDVYHAPEAHDEPALTAWLWPLLGALAILGLGLFFWPTGNRTPTVVPPVAQAPPPAPTPPPVTVPPRLEVTNVDGVAHISGSVRDEDARTAIVNALKSVFGADKVQGDIHVDANRAVAPWLVNFRNGIESLKSPGVQAVFDGNSVDIGGAIGEDNLNRITESMRSVLGGSLVFGSLVNHTSAATAAVDKAAADNAAADKAAADKPAGASVVADKTADLVVAANMKAATELASLKSESSADDLLTALNHAIVNFPTGSTEVPASLATFLASAGGHLKELANQLPPGTVLEIAGHTDNTGDAAANVALSQKRAEAVRDVFIKAGADPGMLIAKGFGGADPIASNDTPEGRFKNRRIEYRLVKAP